MVVRAVDRDVLGGVFGEGGHERLEVGLAADFAHELGGEVGVHAGAVPVQRAVVGPADRFAVELDVDAVFLAETNQQVTGDPDIIGGLLGAFAENLEFPLAGGHLGVDALMVDAGVQTEIEMLLDDLAGDIADILVADARVVGTLRGGITTLGEAERAAILIQEVFLLETEPGVRIVENGGAGIGDVGRAVGVVNLAHDEDAVLTGGVRIERDRLQYAVGTAAGGLLGRASVKAPQGQLLELGEAGEFLDLGLAAKIRDRRVTIEPDVF